MKTVLKIITVVLMFIMLFSIVQINVVQANGIDELEGQDADFFNPSQKKNTKEEDRDEFIKRMSRIVAIIRNVGIVIAVIALMLIGIKEMTASTQEKSNIKQALPGYLVGVVLVVAMATLPSLIFALVKTF